jgi:hypothetical protein
MRATWFHTSHFETPGSTEDISDSRYETAEVVHGSRKGQEFEPITGVRGRRGVERRPRRAVFRNSRDFSAPWDHCVVRVAILCQPGSGLNTTVMYMALSS